MRITSTAATVKEPLTVTTRFNLIPAQWRSLELLIFSVLHRALFSRVQLFVPCTTQSQIAQLYHHQVRFFHHINIAYSIIAFCLTILNLAEHCYVKLKKRLAVTPHHHEMSNTARMKGRREVVNTYQGERSNYANYNMNYADTKEALHRLAQYYAH